MAAFHVEVQVSKTETLNLSMPIEAENRTEAENVATSFVRNALMRGGLIPPHVIVTTRTSPKYQVHGATAERLD